MEEKNLSWKKLGRKDLIKALQWTFRSSHTHSPHTHYPPLPCLRVDLVTSQYLRWETGKWSISIAALALPRSTGKAACSVDTQAVCSRGEGFYPAPTCRTAKPTPCASPSPAPLPRSPVLAEHTAAKTEFPADPGPPGANPAPHHHPHPFSWLWRAGVGNHNLWEGTDCLGIPSHTPNAQSCILQVPWFATIHLEIRRRHVGVGSLSGYSGDKIKIPLIMTC